MARDIDLQGAIYRDVPAILLPTDGGGTAKFYDMDTSLSWLGKSAEIVDDNLYNYSATLADTSFNGWTPSTTAKAIIASKTAKTRSITDMADCDYFILWQSGVDVEYNEGTTNKAKPLFSRSLVIQQLFRRPASWATIESENYNGNVCATALTANFMRYYGSTTGTVTYSWGVSYGFYLAATAATFSPTTGNATVTIKTPVLNARCSTTYLSTGNCALINQDDSTVYIKGKLIRINRDGFLRGGYGMVVDMINGNGW